ncbi:MAG: lysophospholipid acyltransferase family protein [Acidobacteriota bacterium]
MTMIVAWSRSLSAYLFLCLYVLAVGPPALVMARLTGRVRHLFGLGYAGARTARRILGVRLAVRGVERIDPARPAVYVINHRSNVDAVIFEALFPHCPRLRVIYKAEMGKLPILGSAMRVAGFVPVARRDRDQAIAAVDLAVERVRAGDSFLLAPEGTRNPGKGLLPFKKGAFVLAIKAGVPVIPVAISGAAETMPKGRYYVTPGTVIVEIGEALAVDGLSLEDRDRLADETRARLTAMLSHGTGDWGLGSRD